MLAYQLDTEIEGPRLTLSRKSTEICHSLLLALSASAAYVLSLILAF